LGESRRRNNREARVGGKMFNKENVKNTFKKEDLMNSLTFTRVIETQGIIRSGRG